MAQSLKSNKALFVDQELDTINAANFEIITGNSIDSMESLPTLWRLYNSLPTGIHKDYVWDELFTILSSVLRVVLKSAPETIEPEVVNGEASLDANFN